MSLEIVRDGSRQGLRLTFEDQGPGIADIDRALADGYSTSTVGVGTCVTVVQWKP